MGIDLEQHFSKEKDEVIKDNDLFSQIDLDEFTTLVNKQEDFDMLVKWLKTKNILTEINKEKKLENIINANIENNKDQIAIFTMEYNKLNPNEQNLYEICVLWALLQEQIQPTTTPDYKVLAKAYYEKINPTQVDKTKKYEDGTYVWELTSDEKREGKGTFTWKNGYIYTGEFKNDKMEWTGTYKIKNRSTYIGEFKNDQFEGKGTYTRESGNTYTGEFKNNKFEGKGIYTRNNGDTYEWIWKDDKKEWEGIFTKKDGTKSKQIRENDVQKKEIFSDGKTEKIEQNITGNYGSAIVEMTDTKVVGDITTETTVTQWKTITNAEVTVSAGADMRIMKNIKEAERMYNEKISTLEKKWNNFQISENKKQIENIVAELKDEAKINTITWGEEQKGNGYLIGARIAEGFIKALDNLTYTTETKLTLKIDWDNCIIGTENKNIPDDRYLNIVLSVTKADKNANEKEQTKTNPEVTNTPEVTTIIPETKIDGNNNNQDGIITGSWPNNQEGIAIWNTNNKPEEIKETPETLQLKHDIADHFTLKTEKLSAQDITDIVQDATNPKKYTATINWYTDFVVSYTGENIEITTWVVKKWLLKRDIKEWQSTKVDRVSKEKITKDISLVFDGNKSKEYINQKLKTTTTGDQGAYEVKNDADVTEGNIKLTYTNTKILKPVEGKEIIDTITVSLDSEYMISKGKDKNIPNERQKQSGSTEKVNCISPYKIDDKTNRITYYAKTSWGAKDPTINIINNIAQITDESNGGVSKKPLFNEYTNLTKQDKTLERYTEKVMLAYDTPAITSIEKQFKNTASVEYKDKKYAITTTFDIPGKEALVMTLPITYIEWSADNQNTSSVKYEKIPLLSRTDEYNKIENNMVMIDGIIYEIGVANQKKTHLPTIFFRHREDKTLEKAKEWTQGYKIESNIFGIKTANDEIQGYKNVNAGFGNCEYGPLTVKEGKWKDPIYYKDIYIGQVKEGNRILLQWTKVWTIDFDKYGKFLEYKTNEQQMTFDKQINKVDLTQHTPIGIKDPLGETGKNILLTHSLEGNKLKVDIMNPEHIYTGTTTGENFIKSQNATDKYFYTSAETKLTIAEKRISIYEALKKISSDDIDEKSQNLFNFVMEKDTTPNKVLGPDRKWIYAYQIIQANWEYPAQYLYCKANNEKISLCNADGDILDQQKIFLEANNDYYNIKTNDDQTQFIISGKDKEKQTKMPKVEIETDKNDVAYTGDLNNDRYCGYRSSKPNEDSYQFMCGKYKSFEVTVKGENIEGTDKITDIGSFSLTDENQEGFGSYKDFFMTAYQKDIWLDEKTYKEVFGKVLKEKETENGKLIKVKYKKDNKFYYAPMYLDVEKKGNKNIFSIKESKGWKEAIKETEKRLDNLVKAYNIFLEQDITTDKRKGDILQWRYLVRPTMESTNAYFKDPTQNITLSLQTNNKIAGEYQKETIVFNPSKENIEQKEITINNIKYSLTLKRDKEKELGYKIIVKKEEVVE